MNLKQPELATSPTSPRSPLRERSFALVWAGGLVSDTGDWLLLIALPIYVFTLTGSALNTSTVFLAELIPALLFGSFAGVLVDRWNRRRTMLVTNLLQAGLLVPLLAVARDRLWVLYVVAAIQACLASLFVPAKHALLTRLVDGPQLMAANALIGVNDNMARLVGAPLGGLAMVAVGLRGVVALDASSFLISAALLAACRPAQLGVTGDPITSRSFCRDWLHGLGVVARIRSLRVVLVITALGQLAQGMFVVLFVVFVLRTLRGTGTDVGLLRGVQAIGGVVGGLLVGTVGRRVSSVALIAYGYLAFGALSLVIWNAPRLTTALGFYIGLFIAIGIPGLAVLTGVTTTVQLCTPGDALGRALGAIATTAQGTQALGVLIAGLAADRFNVVSVLDIQAGIYLCCGVLALTSLRASSPNLPTP